MAAESQGLYYSLSPYVVNIIKHVLLIAIGVAPGYAPAVDESYAPVKLLQKAYINFYGLEVIPTIMQPSFYSRTEQLPVYYSLQKLECSMYSSTYTRRSALQELLIIKNVIYAVMDSISSSENISLYNLNDIEFSFFHTSAQTNADIKNISQLIDDDVRFSTLLYNTTLDFKVADNASFFRGCIRISKRSS